MSSATGYTCIVLIKMDRYKKKKKKTYCAQLYQCTCRFFFSYRPKSVEKRSKDVKSKTLKVANSPLYMRKKLAFLS
jgi:hypothetical protein